MLPIRFLRGRARLCEATRWVPLGTGFISLARVFVAAQRRQFKRPLILEFPHLALCSSQERHAENKGNQERQTQTQPNAEPYLHPGLPYIVFVVFGGRPYGLGRSRDFSTCEDDLADITCSVVFDAAGWEAKRACAIVGNIVGGTSPIVELALALP